MVLVPMVLFSLFMRKLQASRSAQPCRRSTRCTTPSTTAACMLRPPAAWIRWQAVLTREIQLPFWNSSDTTPMTSAETRCTFQKVYVWSHRCLSCRPARNSLSSFTRQLPHSSRRPCRLRATSITFSTRYPFHLQGGHWNFMVFMNPSSARDLGPVNSLSPITLFERPSSFWDWRTWCRCLPVFF